MAGMRSARLGEVFVLVLVAAIFIGAAYLVVMAAGPSMTRMPNPSYIATPMSRPGGP